MDREQLSPKEIEVLALIAKGHDAKSAAQELSVSTHTIYERLRRAREKLGASNSREAARLFFSPDPAVANLENAPLAALNDIAAAFPESYLGFPAQRPEAREPAPFAQYEAASVRNDPGRGLPLRAKGERLFQATTSDRIRMISDLSSRLAVVFVSICLAVLVLSQLMRS